MPAGTLATILLLKNMKRVPGILIAVVGATVVAGIFDLESRKLLGAHIIGEGATELVHIGQAVLNLGGTVDYFVENAFNYPTLAEAYKVAALDAMNKIRQIDRLS